jgi:uncharacterized protein YggE
VVGQEARAGVSLHCSIAAAADAARAAMESGADRLHGPALRVSSVDAVAEELVAKAVAAARRKAQRAADAAGRSLGRVLSVAEEHDREEWAYAVSASGLADGERLHAPPVRPDALTLSARVTVVVALID